MLGARSYRKRPLFRVPSPSKDTEHQTSPVSIASRASKYSTGSGASKRSRGQRKSITGTVASRKSFASGAHSLDGLGLVQGKYLRIREWLLILIEIFISFAAWVICERNANVHELVRVGLTGREMSVYMLYWQGWAAFGSWFTGVLADSYVGHYNFALFSVALHFGVVCIVFMEDTIKGNQKGNPYDQLVWNITTISTLFMKSTDFTRVVFGLERMENQTKSTIMMFIFLISWVNGAAYGGLIVNLSGPVEYAVYVRISFFTSGVCLYLYVYVLRPTTKREYSGIGIKVVRCFIIACLGKFLRLKRKKKGWLDGTEGRCDKTTIGKTKEILKFYSAITPTFGYALISVLRLDTFFASYFKATKSVGLIDFFGDMEFARIILLISSLLTYFLVWPLFPYFKVKKDTDYKFFLGFLAGLIAIYYASFVLRTVEFLHFDKSTGYVRIFNTREAPVTISPQDRSFSTHEYSVGPNSSTMVAYPIRKRTLFPVNVGYIGTKVNFTVYLSLEPQAAVGYIALDPPEIARINGKLPIQEGPPGTNIGTDPRLYLYNVVKTLENAILVVKGFDDYKTVKRYRLGQGNLTSFQLKPRRYNFIVAEADIFETFDIKEGALYGLLAYSDVSSRLLAIDEVLPENTESPYTVIPLAALFGISISLAYVALRALCFTAAPEGLLGMSFGYISFLENVACFVLYIGYQTWHPHVTSYTAFAYSFVVTILFFLTVFIFIKYKYLFLW